MDRGMGANGNFSVLGSLGGVNVFWTLHTVFEKAFLKGNACGMFFADF